MTARCGCQPGTSENGWHETRSEACVDAERAAFAHAIECAPEIAWKLRAEREASQVCRECAETKHGACDGSALVDDGHDVLQVDCLCAAGGHS